MVLINTDFLEIHSIVKCFVAGNITFKMTILEKTNCLVNGFMIIAQLSEKKK